MGKLYIVATPIGNLGDMTQRAVDTLGSVDLLIAEDTRVSKKLLNHFQIDIPIQTYNQHSFRNQFKLLQILQILKNGKNIALVTDAGTPGISDPGNELISFLVASDPAIEIIPIPGVSAVTAAISVCGFDMQRYIFVGFVPKKKQQKFFDPIIKSELPVVFFESPHRLLKTLQFLKNMIDGTRPIFVAREITKLHEQLYRGTLDELLAKLPNENPKGEVVVIISCK